MNGESKAPRLEELAGAAGVEFGTSGVRGPVAALTDLVAYAFTAAFVQYLADLGELPPGGRVGLGGDLRPSTPRLAAAARRAVVDRGLHPVECGALPSPAVALYGLTEQIPTVMITGSHIPEDRNGLKFNRATGEILKHEEAAIRGQRVLLPEGLFDQTGAFRAGQAPSAGEPAFAAASERYAGRYLAAFPLGCLAGLRVGVYEHSSVARELLGRVLAELGAEVVPLGRSEAFVPVDTEALRPEDVALAREWAAGGAYDALVSADGDGDRPLVADERGRWLRGDVAGLLCARFIGAEVVVVPVTCNTAVERCGAFRRVVRTRIGSPYVVEAMAREVERGERGVVGYEANGGFLTATSLRLGGGELAPLPTRDALIVAVALLSRAAALGVAVSSLVRDLPARMTASGRVRDVPAGVSHARLAELSAGGRDRLLRVGEAFGAAGVPVVALDETDGLRARLANGEIVHVRPSGNAPELRCYAEADSEERAAELVRRCLERLEVWR